MKFLPQLVWGRGTAPEGRGGGAPSQTASFSECPTTSLRLVPLPETSSGRY